MIYVLVSSWVIMHLVFLLHWALVVFVGMDRLLLVILEDVFVEFGAPKKGETKMELEYVQSMSAVEPKLLEIGVTTAWLRKNPRQIEMTQPVYDAEGNVISEEPAGYSMWVYEEAKMPIEEFTNYAQLLIMQSQTDSTNNQLAIMEAFADLYETMAMSL